MKHRTTKSGFIETQHQSKKFKGLFKKIWKVQNVIKNIFTRFLTFGSTHTLNRRVCVAHRPCREHHCTQTASKYRYVHNSQSDQSYETVISSPSDSDSSDCLLESADGDEALWRWRWGWRRWGSWLLPTSVRSGWGLALVGRVCWRQPPVDSSSRSLEFLHFILRFWNQIFTWVGPENTTVSLSADSRRIFRLF